MKNPGIKTNFLTVNYITDSMDKGSILPDTCKSKMFANFDHLNTSVNN